MPAKSLIAGMARSYGYPTLSFTEKYFSKKCEPSPKSERSNIMQRGSAVFLPRRPRCWL